MQGNLFSPVYGLMQGNLFSQVYGLMQDNLFSPVYGLMQGNLFSPVYCLMQGNLFSPVYTILVRVEAWAHTTSLTPPLCVEVSVSSKNSNRSCIWVIGVDSASVSTIL